MIYQELGQAKKMGGIKVPRIRRRLSLGLASLTILFTILVVMDLQLDLGYSGHHLVPSHGRIKLGDPPDRDTVYNNFRRKFLRIGANGSRELPASAEPATQTTDRLRSESQQTEEEPHDDFADLVAYVAKGESASGDEGVIRISGEDTSDNPTIADLKGFRTRENATILTRFQMQISKREMYPENSRIVEELLELMATQPIVRASEKTGGTQLKLVMEYPDNVRALFKPMRFPREQQTLPNHFYFTDYERHNAEIAAFHLDRVLGFRRCMPVVGRLINITSEVYQVTEGDILKTFFVSPAGNLCFHGKCTYYCDTGHAICGSPDTLEGSFAAFLPEKQEVPRKVWRHPWRRSYHKRLKAQWETDSDYCNMVRELPPFNEGRRLLDLVDMAVLDFLMGNMDRHHYETFKIFGNETFPLHLDNGRGFGKPFHDEITCLSPLLQCCLLRRTTLATLLRYHNGPIRLSSALRESLAKDPLAPILWEPHFAALDRRVGIILKAVRDCVKRNSQWENVVRDEKSEISEPNGTA